MNLFETLPEHYLKINTAIVTKNPQVNALARMFQQEQQFDL